MEKYPIQWKQQKRWNLYVSSGKVFGRGTFDYRHFDMPKVTQLISSGKHWEGIKRNHQTICYTGVTKSFLPRAGSFPWLLLNSCSSSASLTSEKIHLRSINVAPEISKKIISMLPSSLSKHWDFSSSDDKNPTHLCNCAQKNWQNNLQNYHNFEQLCLQVPCHILFPFLSSSADTVLCS